MAWPSVNLPTYGWITGLAVLTADKHGRMRLIECCNNQIKYATPQEAVAAATAYEFEIVNGQGGLAIFCILDSYRDDSGGLNSQSRR